MQVKLKLYPLTTAIILTLIALGLAILGFALEVYEWNLGVNNNYWAYELSDLLNVTYEGNVPTWYNSLLLLTAAGLSFIIAQHTFQNKQPNRIHWVGLFIVFLYLSFDEAAAIHEAFTSPLQANYNTSGYFYFAWILVGIPAALIVGGLFLPFVLKLPARVRLMFFLSAISYLGGALFVESFGANMYYLNDEIATPRYTAVGGVEEFMEMFGVILAIYALMIYMKDHIQTVSLIVSESPPDDE